MCVREREKKEGGRGRGDKKRERDIYIYIYMYVSFISYSSDSVHTEDSGSAENMKKSMG